MMRAWVTVAARVLACCAAALVLLGCAAGQIAQTSHDFSAVDGASGNVGNTIALRDVLIPYPLGQAGTYPAGSTVPVSLSIINQGDTPDELIGVDSPAASQVLVEGTTQIPPGTVVISTTGPAPASPLIIGELRVVLITNQALHAGLDTPLTFQFRHAGKVTLTVPLGAHSD